MKKTYRAKHDGKEFTRTTGRSYSHVIVVKGVRCDGEYHHGPIYWVGRPDLVAGQVKAAGKIFKPADVHVVELVQPAESSIRLQRELAALVGMRP